ncbi:hypothetical protein AK812_SmicGene1480 [Symbiodinium microadriaticum]|uniref:Uncharacterized protein n=1 Tax=Symbiodinium microadriaticum TaxID=2951 RepID=A0A1Q9F3Y4_SYMMI|nr:hypothetical protein AK812_SmicGene1480 [Symbiodinium microadriaticum]
MGVNSKPDCNGLFNPMLLAADQKKAGAANNIDVETWVSAGGEPFTSENIFTHMNVQQNYIATWKSLHLNGRVELEMLAIHESAEGGQVVASLSCGDVVEQDGPLIILSSGISRHFAPEGQQQVPCHARCEQPSDVA